MIRKEVIDDSSKKYKLIVEGIEREFEILIGGSDLYFYLSEYEMGNCVTIPNSDETTYQIFAELLKRMKKVDSKNRPSFSDNTFMWISDSGIPEECNRLQIYHRDGNIVFDFWRNPIRSFSDCSISFCTFGAINQDIVNELMYFYNSYTECNVNREKVKRKRL